MLAYLDKTGLAYLWGKIKTSLTGLVSSVSINGNTLRVTKNGTNTDLTIPYATNAYSAISATKATQDGSGNNIEVTYQKKADVPAAITGAEMDSVLEE